MVEFSLDERKALYGKEVELPFFCADIFRKVSPYSRCEKCYINNRAQWENCWILMD